MRIITLSALLLAHTVFAPAAELPRVELHTSEGVIVMELDSEKAPKTVDNFLNYVRTRYYDGMIFHRVIDDWVVQSGGYPENDAASSAPSHTGNTQPR